MPKQLLFHAAARASLQHGIDRVGDAVKMTLGPRGRAVALAIDGAAPMITHDGSTVAQALVLPDRFENIGAQLLIEVAQTTNTMVGDGTTTATILAQALIGEGLKLVAAGANPILLKRGLDLGGAAVLAALAAAAQPVRHPVDMARVAGVAANDGALGALIASVMTRVGAAGVITIEAGRGTQTEVIYTDGMQIDYGYASPSFVTDAARHEAVLDTPQLLITDAAITDIHAILPLIGKAVPQGKQLVLVVEDISDEILSALVLNKIRGVFNPMVIKIPGNRAQRRELLDDLAVRTGGTVISRETGRALASATLADLGHAQQIRVGAGTTSIIHGAGDPTQIARRSTQLQTLLAATTSDGTQAALALRLARLQGCVAVIRVGATTEPELNDRVQRLEDALATARAASEQGIVPGGGLALLHAATALDGMGDEGDVRLGVALLRHALAEPMRQLATNAGQSGAVIVDAVRRHSQATGDASYGYNVLTGAFGDLRAMGVIDPVKVTRCAVQNAVSITGLLLTMDVLITGTGGFGPINLIDD